MLSNSIFLYCLKAKWGSWSLVCLCISILSGILVGLQYDPAAPYYTTTAIDLLIPYGQYFRSLHFYSSQFFFLLTIIHLLAAFPSTDSYTSVQWFRLVFALPVMLLLLFTGYVLRADSTGTSAGFIAESVLLAVPLVGPLLNNLLFAMSEHGMQRVYIAHVITLDLIWLILAWEHLRRYRIRFTDNLAITGLVLLFSVIIAAPIDPEKLGVTYISGPWFFLGLQELLRYLPPILAGFLFPIAFILALLMAQKRSRFFIPVVLFLCIWLLSYLALTIIALLR
ncbi:MAG: cytochrome b N-terminal domain-containing protein [Desulfoprunum sp.]|nr:cytochrome b N-terminal domain-containing protein [Desulfoprunum sp.]